MAYDGYLLYDNVEIINVARTALLARALGVSGVQVSQRTIDLVTETVGGIPPSSDINEAPWFDIDYQPSREFVGILPMALQGLGESSLEASVTEYVSDGGSIGKARNGSQDIVADLVLVGSTEAGVEYGLRWLNRVLTGDRDTSLCNGAELRYLRSLSDDTQVLHRNDVALTRGASITRRTVKRCHASMRVTLTLTAGDPFEYSDPVVRLNRLGGGNPVAAGTLGTTSGALTGTVQSCPVFDYSPIYDPLYPALVASPTAPDFLPAGWNMPAGMAFKRYWARVRTVFPSQTDLVPVFRVSTPTAARMVRISVFPTEAADNTQCGALFSTVLSYLPVGTDFYIDGEARAAYVSDGVSPYVRRTDSLAYSPDANPVQWTAFNFPNGFLVTLDLMSTGGSTYQGNDQVQLALSLVTKSD